MEKYAVDIDKVLDDFEETEALNVNNKHKSADESLLQPSVLVNSHEESQLLVNQNTTNFENINNKEDNVNSCEENLLHPDKNKLSKNSLHNANCVKLIEASERSDRLNFNFSDKEESFSNHAVEPDISECLFNGYSLASVSTLIETATVENHDSHSVDVNDKDRNLSPSLNGVKCSFEKDCVSISSPQTIEEHGYESTVREINAMLLSDNSSNDTVLVGNTCHVPSHDSLNCDNETKDISEPSMVNNNISETVMPSQESNAASFASTNIMKDINLNGLDTASLTNDLNEKSSSSVNTELSDNTNVASSDTTTERNLNDSGPFSSGGEFIEQNHHPEDGLNNATVLVKCEEDVLKLGACASDLHEQNSNLDTNHSASNCTGLENKGAKSCGIHCNCGLHCLVHAFETASENIKQSLKNEELHADSNSGAAASREHNRCDCHKVHPPSFCMQPGMCPHLLDNFAEISSEELQYRHSSGADNCHSLNQGDENREASRCNCWGCNPPPNVCFHQNVRLPILPIYEDISDDDDDSGVSSEDEHGGPLFFFNNRIIIDQAGVDMINQDVHAHQNLPGPSHDNNLDAKENETSDANNSGSSDLPVSVERLTCYAGEAVQQLFRSRAVAAAAALASGSSINCQSPNKFTGARSKLETAWQMPVDDTEVDKENSNKDENTDLESDKESNAKEVPQCIENEAISEVSLLDVCDNSEKSIDMSPNISIDDQSNNLQNANVENKCENVAITCNIDSLSVTENDNECLSVDSDINDLKADGFPQRLPRPTTLDLPSRHIAASQISESELALSENNLECATGLNIVPSEILVKATTSEEITPIRQQPQIGLVKPFWIPDAEAPNCMHCGMKFTVIKRRHHCRACGKVLCSRCCNLRAKLAYLNKEDRICHPCFEILSSTSQNENVPVSVAADSQSSSSCGSSPNFSPSPQVPNTNFSDKNAWRPHPNNPDDYCSTIPPLEQVQLTGPRPPPTVLVPIGVLKRGNKPRKEPKQVIFSDGIRPGGDLTDLTEPTDVIPVYRRMGRKRVERASAGDSVSLEESSPSNIISRNKQKRVVVSDEEGPLPPIVLQIDDKIMDDKLEWKQILERIQDDDHKPVNFALLKNMHMFVKLTKLDCCFGKECWCFTSHGLCAVGQDEIMVVLERLPEENTVPRGIIKLFTYIYDSASKGSTFDDLGHIIFPEQILGSSDHRGFLFVRPTFQCLSKLVVPNTPFLVAILIHKWEVPWAKVFPLRLMLRLGAECRYYPCALVSVRHRKPVFFEIGQTIMSVLADLRNYQFTIPVIPGLVVHMEEKKTCVNIPRNRYEKVMKVLNSNNVEHVLALGSNFSSEADSHLVCMQKEEGDYQTQAINIENTTRRVTGASFIVFSGALKSSSGLSAKFSIVEDGLLVQIPQETMVALHMALRDMKDLTIECGQINAAEPEEIVTIQWTRDDKKFNLGVRSPIDGKSLEGVPNLRIHTSTDYAGENFLIRWTEVFFLELDESDNSIQHELVDPCRLAETVGQSCCMALAPYLDQLAESELTKIGLRVILDSERDRVEYDIGARGKPLPAVYMNALDCGLIPVILRLSSSAQSEPVSFELIFHILIK